MSSSNSPCAACKFQRRKCTEECIFAPYFPPDQPQKFENVHKIFGASNISKMLNDLNPTHREEAVNSLVNDAEARLRDPVYGAPGLISILQHNILKYQTDLCNSKKNLASYLGPQAMLPITQPSVYLPQNLLENNVLGLGTENSASEYNHAQRHQQQQIHEAQQLAAALDVREKQDMVRAFEPKQLFNQQAQDDHLRFNVGGFDLRDNSVSATGWLNQMNGAVVAPSLALAFDSPYTSNQLVESQFLLSPQQTQLQRWNHQSQQAPYQQKSEDEEGGNVGPSC